MKLFRVCLFCALWFLATINNAVLAKNLVVATYNLWNVMFQWDSRKYYIAYMVRNIQLLSFVIRKTLIFINNIQNDFDVNSYC